jgi:hypothetical protein
MKICSVCKIEKELDEFNFRKESKDGYRANCKECVKVTAIKYKKNNSEKIKKAQKEWVKNNPEKRKKIQDKYNQKKERQEQKKIWAKNNREKGYLWFNEKYKNDVLFNLKIKFRRRIYMAIRHNNIKKTNKMIDLLGCTYLELKNHIEFKFTDGMSWDLVMSGKIHLDHIIPLSLSKNEDDLKKLCHFENLQPLWAEENLRKSNKVL